MILDLEGILRMVMEQEDLGPASELVPGVVGPILERLEHRGFDAVVDEILSEDYGFGSDPVIDPVVYPRGRRSYPPALGKNSTGGFDPGPSVGSRHSNVLGTRFPVNIIPGKGSTACHAALVAFARGTRGRAAFQTVMQAVKVHLIDCFGTTKLVVLVTDRWNLDEFLRDHFREWQAHYRKGVRFVVLYGRPPVQPIVPILLDYRRPLP